MFEKRHHILQVLCTLILMSTKYCNYFPEYINRCYKRYRTMNTITIVVAAVIFALVGTLVFGAIAPSLYEVDAKRDLAVTCPKGTLNAGLSPPCGGPPIR